MDEPLARAVSAALGTKVRALARAHSGNTEAFVATLEDGTRAFVKTADAHPRGWASAEAMGLTWLSEPGALRIPRVLAASDTPPAFLVLEHLEPAPPAEDHDARLGRGLAALHRAGAPSFGLARDGFLAGLPQSNGPCASIVELWGLHRLEPMLRRVADRGLATSTLKRGIERVLLALPALVGPEEPPARLHGDLWAGNAITDASGAPALVDPAAYGGHREIDLAMMRLFGGFSAHVFDAYDEAHPLADGHEDRVALWQLYPLLVHVALFGGGYVAQTERTLGALV